MAASEISSSTHVLPFGGVRDDDIKPGSAVVRLDGEVGGCRCGAGHGVLRSREVQKEFLRRRRPAARPGPLGVPDGGAEILLDILGRAVTLRPLAPSDSWGRLRGHPGDEQFRLRGLDCEAVFADAIGVVVEAEGARHLVERFAFGSCLVSACGEIIESELPVRGFPR